MSGKTLAEILTQARERSGYSIRVAADLIGTSIGYLSALETGKCTNPALRIVAGICDLYGISAKQIIDTARKAP